MMIIRDILIWLVVLVDIMVYLGIVLTLSYWNILTTAMLILITIIFLSINFFVVVGLHTITEGWK